MTGETTQARGHADGGRPTGADEPLAQAIREAIGGRDHAAIKARLAEDVVLHSPVGQLGFRGRELVATVIGSLLRESERWAGEWRFDDVFSEEGGVCTFAFRGRVGGHGLELFVIARTDDRGMIEHMTTYGRPMSAIAAFPAFVFPHVVARHSSRRRARIVQILCRPLPRLLAIGTNLVFRFARIPGTTVNGRAIGQAPPTRWR